MKLYSYVQSTPLCEIRARKIWHIVICWQYLVHVAVSTESLAETVGSFLSQIDKSQPNLSITSIAWGAQLKALGIHGTGGEEGFHSMALNSHFACQGPEGWHVFNQAAIGANPKSTSHWRKPEVT